ncbi:hypothetical protein [Streptomyces sp. NPDC058874]|uniref:hypothetical protein n=1 Tax=unclassified Streptomyces TaxID=2593676 RepID=UPI003686FE71
MQSYTMERVARRPSVGPDTARRRADAGRVVNRRGGAGRPPVDGPSKSARARLARA